MFPIQRMELKAYIIGFKKRDSYKMLAAERNLFCSSGHFEFSGIRPGNLGHLLLI